MKSSKDDIQQAAQDSPGAESLERDVERLLDQAAAPQDAPAPSPKPAPPQSNADDDLLEAVSSLLEDAAETAPGATPAHPAPPPIQSIDAELSALADEMIAGEFTDESGQIVAADDPAPPAPPTPDEGSWSVDDEPVAPPPTAAAPRKEPPAPTPEPPPAEAAWDPEPATDPPRAVAAPPAPLKQAPAPAPTPAAPPAPEPGPAPARTPLPDRLLTALAAPLHGRPDLRQLVCWAAAVTIFNATCAWTYVLLFRTGHEAPSTTTNHVELHAPPTPPPEPAAPPHNKPS